MIKEFPIHFPIGWGMLNEFLYSLRDIDIIMYVVIIPITINLLYRKLDTVPLWTSGNKRSRKSIQTEFF